MPTFPNVPIAPGVPPLLRNPFGSVLSVVLLVRDALTAFGLLLPRWGVFKDGVPAIQAETVVDFGYRQSWDISNYPIEGGGFESYNKVQTPFAARVRFASGSTLLRPPIILLQSIEAIAGNVELYDVVTPERVYRKANVVHYDYRRTSTNGAEMIIVDVWLNEVRLAAQTAFSDTKSPSGASPSESGIVQPIPFATDGGFDSTGVT